MLERQGRIFTTVVDDVSAETLMAEIQQHSEKGSVSYTDRFKSYKSLKFYGKHLMVNHGVEFAKGRRHINGLEGVWSFAKERLLKYHGVSQNHFYPYLKEMEFRYPAGIPLVQLQKSKSLSTVEENPLWTGF